MTSKAQLGRDALDEVVVLGAACGCSLGKCWRWCNSGCWGSLLSLLLPITSFDLPRWRRWIVPFAHAASLLVNRMCHSIIFHPMAWLDIAPAVMYDGCVTAV